MARKSEKILNGMNEISDFLGRSNVTVLKLYRESNLPIKKANGIWVSHRDKLEQWLENYVAGEV